MVEMKNARVRRASLWISVLISILARKRVIVGQIGASLNCLVSFGCGKSDLRKGLTRISRAHLPAGARTMMGALRQAGPILPTQAPEMK